MINHKLTDEQALEIAKSSSPRKELAKQYGVSKETIRSIKLRKNYQHVTKDIEIVATIKRSRKLTDQQVREIAASGESANSIAKHYGVTIKTIINIKQGITYREVTKDMNINNQYNQRKLTDEQVLEVYHSNKTCATLSEEYNLCASTISLIKRGKTYKEVTYEEPTH